MASRASCCDLAGDETRPAADLSSQRENILLIPPTPRPSLCFVHPSLQAHSHKLGITILSALVSVSHYSSLELKACFYSFHVWEMNF